MAAWLPPAFLRFFFFQAEDGIRDLTVTGVQTCALPISRSPSTGESRIGSECFASSVSPRRPKPFRPAARDTDSRKERRFGTASLFYVCQLNPHAKLHAHALALAKLSVGTAIRHSGWRYL